MKISTARAIQRRSRIIKARLPFRESDEDIVLPPPNMISKPKPRRRHAMVSNNRLKRKGLGRQLNAVPAPTAATFRESDRSIGMRESLMRCPDCIGGSLASMRSSMGILEDQFKHASIHCSRTRDAKEASKKKEKKKPTAATKHPLKKPERRHGIVIRASPQSRPPPAARLVSNTPGTGRETWNAPFEKPINC
jgi:hypothetical protein